MAPRLALQSIGDDPAVDDSRSQKWKDRDDERQLSAYRFVQVLTQATEGAEDVSVEMLSCDVAGRLDLHLCEARRGRANFGMRALVPFNATLKNFLLQVITAQDQPCRTMESSRVESSRAKLYQSKTSKRANSYISLNR